MDLLQHSRYKDTPVYIFFENYILDVIGQLTDDRRSILQDIDLQKVFSTQATAWRDVVRETLQLSSTIDLSIIYEWYKFKDSREAHNIDIDPSQFSKEFVDNYFAENSTLDIWDEKSLMEAKEFVHQHQNVEKV